MPREKSGKFAEMVSRIKRQFKESLSGRIYYNVKKFPPVRLFFDFEYASRLWQDSRFSQLAQKLLSGLNIPKECGYFKIGRKFFVLLLCFCPVMAAIGQGGGAMLLTLISAVLFLSGTGNKNFRIIFFSQLVMTAVFALTFPFSVFVYIIYVETGIILFFIIKYLDKTDFIRMIYILSVFWLAAGAFLPEIKGGGALTVFLLPYALMVLCKGRIKKYFSAAVLLGIGFYVLSMSGRGGIIGGSIGIVLLIISGERWLILPVIIAAPAVVSFAEGFIKNGALTENLVKTGMFFWKYGFGGAAVGYGGEINSAQLKIISDISAVSVFIFFWYVLRISRSAVVKLFKKKGKNIRFLRSGLASVVGFSVYTFFAYNGNLPINIILYLCSAAMLKRSCSMERIREETGGNGRKTDF